MTGSTPSCMATRQPAQLGMRTMALWLSVTLAASTQSRSRRALRRIGAMFAPRGGPISAVTAKRPRCRTGCSGVGAVGDRLARASPPSATGGGRSIAGSQHRPDRRRPVGPQALVSPSQ